LLISLSFLLLSSPHHKVGWISSGGRRSREREGRRRGEREGREDKRKEERVETLNVYSLSFTPILLSSFLSLSSFYSLLPVREWSGSRE